MECNKDEALRAKEIAERKVGEKDYTGAKKFALKAQNLYPQLDGLSQMLTTVNVFISSETKIGGESDWYGVLGVTPSADDDTIKKQYRKLALMLHPDKNKAVGADGAFKLVSEAWSLLGNKDQRLVYNHRRNPMGDQYRPTGSGVSSKAAAANGFNSSKNHVPSNVKPKNTHTRVEPPSFSAPNRETGTFWTICNRCNTQYEYLKLYLNQTLLCPNCREAFTASEKRPPPSASAGWSSHKEQNLKNHTASSGRDSVGGRASSNNINFQRGLFSGTSGVNSTTASGSAPAQAANVAQSAHEKIRKRNIDDARGTTAWDAYKRTTTTASKTESYFKKMRAEDVHSNGYGGSVGARTGFGKAVDPGRVNSASQNVYGPSSYENRPIGNRELTAFEVRKHLISKARSDIQKKLKEWSLSGPADKDKKKAKVTSDDHDAKNNDLSGATGRRSQDEKSRPNSSADNSNKEDTKPVSINVPDPDFHNFDLDRAERSFGEDHVWAAYDGDDGMPRYYARIHSVISLKPFKMKISWLNSRSNSELGSLNWVGSGFPKTCGDFRLGRHEITETLNAFSHKVHWTKGPRGVIRIFPKKGDVWALYRNWSPDWNESTPDEVIHKYDMVEVLEDYDEEKGVSVTPLIKVPNFRAVFHKHHIENPDEARRIPREEMFRFSHQVPNYVLTGQEAANAPIGDRELDPAATPHDLLEVIKETPEVENAKADEEGNTAMNIVKSNDSEEQATDDAR